MRCGFAVAKLMRKVSKLFLLLPRQPLPCPVTQSRVTDFFPGLATADVKRVHRLSQLCSPVRCSDATLGLLLSSGFILGMLGGSCSFRRSRATHTARHYGQPSDLQGGQEARKEASQGTRRPGQNVVD